MFRQSHLLFKQEFIQKNSAVNYFFFHDNFGLLTCTLISENQGLEKSRSISDPRKISGSANLDFFPGLLPEKSWVYTINLKKIQVPNLKKNQGLQNLKFFQGLKQTMISQDLDFQKSGCRLKGRHDVALLLQKFALKLD